MSSTFRRAGGDPLDYLSGPAGKKYFLASLAKKYFLASVAKKYFLAGPAVRKRLSSRFSKLSN